MREIFLAETKRAVDILNELDNLPNIEYVKGGSWKENEKYYEVQSKRRQLKNELKNRLTMIRKDAILLRRQVEED